VSERASELEQQNVGKAREGKEQRKDSQEVSE
jgi:hypothetical protein